MVFPYPFARTKTWENIASNKERDTLGKIPSKWVLDAKLVADARSRQSIVGEFFEGLLDDKTKAITSLDVTKLVESMRNDSMTAVQVVKVFSKRAAYAHQLGNYMLEIGFEQAITQAEQLDNYFKEHRKLVGPLHGVPVTLKDQFHIKGLEMTMAYVGWIGTFEGQKGTGKEKITESELIRELGLFGAIPIGKIFTIWEALADLGRIDDPEIHHGAPASIQLIDRKLDEERLLSMAGLVVNALQKLKFKTKI